MPNQARAAWFAVAGRGVDVPEVDVVEPAPVFTDPGAGADVAVAAPTWDTGVGEAAAETRAGDALRGAALPAAEPGAVGVAAGEPVRDSFVGACGVGVGVLLSRVPLVAPGSVCD